MKKQKIPRLPSNNLVNIILKFLEELDINGIKNEGDKFNDFVKTIYENIEELKIFIIAYCGAVNKSNGIQVFVSHFLLEYVVLF